MVWKMSPTKCKLLCLTLNDVIYYFESFNTIKTNNIRIKYLYCDLTLVSHCCCYYCYMVIYWMMMIFVSLWSFGVYLLVHCFSILKCVYSSLHYFILFQAPDTNDQRMAHREIEIDREVRMMMEFLQYIRWLVIIE